MKIATHVFNRRGYLFGTQRMTLLMFGVVFNLLWIGAHSASAQNIPDANFANAIRDQCPTCIDGGNNLLAPAKILGRLVIFNKNIASIEGIIGFTNLTDLDCSDNQLTELPALPTGLTSWGFNNNRLTSLPQIPDKIRNVYVRNNNLTSLPNLPASLFYLSCNDNNLTSLPALPASLNYLLCHNNNITSLPTLPSTILRLNIDAEKITCLPNEVEGLKVHDDYNNDVALDLPVCGIAPVETGIHIPDANFAQAIRDFCPGCINGDNNLLTPATYLTRLEVSNKNISSIEGVNGFTGLKSISAYNNKLTILPALQNGLTDWNFSGNSLTNLPQIPDNVKTLYIGGNNLIYSTRVFLYTVDYKILVI